MHINLSRQIASCNPRWEMKHQMLSKRMRVHAAKMQSDNRMHATRLDERIIRQSNAASHFLLFRRMLSSLSNVSPRFSSLALSCHLFFFFFFQTRLKEQSFSKASVRLKEYRRCSHLLVASGQKFYSRIYTYTIYSDMQ